MMGALLFAQNGFMHAATGAMQESLCARMRQNIQSSFGLMGGVSAPAPGLQTGLPTLGLGLGTQFNRLA
jgi:hypothetical protein